MKRNRRKVIAAGIVAALVAGVVVFEAVAYSPLRAMFQQDADKLVQRADAEAAGGVFTEADFAGFPVPVQRYIRHCGYLGAPKHPWVRIHLPGATLLRDGKPMIVDYTQYDLAPTPGRLALIQASVSGVPFQGYDSFIDGTGGMKGVLGKLVTLFDQVGPQMDQAGLVTLLSEAFILPLILLQDYVQLTGVDDTHVAASITWGGVAASGVFTFDESGEMTTFTTNDRAYTHPDGTMEPMPWTAKLGGYQDLGFGVLFPTRFQAVWHFPDADQVYFDGTVSQTAYKQ